MFKEGMGVSLDRPMRVKYTQEQGNPGADCKKRLVR